MKKFTLLFSVIFSLSLFAGDFYTESTLVDDEGADYVIIKNNKVLDVIDKNTNFSVDVPVANVAPNVNAGPNKTIVIGNSVWLSGTASDVDGRIVAYKWLEGSTVLSKNRSFTYTGTSVGNHTLTFVAVDEEGVSNSDTMVVTVERACPSTYPIDNGDGTCSQIVKVPSLSTYTSSRVKRYPIGGCAGSGYDGSYWTISQLNTSPVTYRINSYVSNMAADYRWRGTGSSRSATANFGTSSSTLLEYNNRRDQTDYKVTVTFDPTNNVLYVKEYDRCKDFKTLQLKASKTLPAYRDVRNTISK